MSERTWFSLLCGMVWCTIILISVILPVSGSTDTKDTQTGFEYRVQEDPFFTFAYPADMTLTVTSAGSRNTYTLINGKEHPVSYLITSAENSEWAPLNETGLAEYATGALTSVTGESTTGNLEQSEPIYQSNANLSSYLISYLDPDAKELIDILILSNSDSIISGVLSQPAALSKTDYGNFTLRSLFSITPRDTGKGFTLALAGNDKSIGEKINGTAGESPDKNIAYDPYLNYFYDTDTGYVYLPEYGVFYDYLTGDYYYPEEFGNYDSDFFVDYSGTYDPDGDYSGYYDNLYNPDDVFSGGYCDDTTCYDFENELYNLNPDLFDDTEISPDYEDIFNGDDSSGNTDSGSVPGPIPTGIPDTTGVTFEGGDGLSMEDAVVIVGARSEMEGIRAESDWISQNYGIEDTDWIENAQYLIEGDSSYYDKLDVYLVSSDETIEIWFNIDDFFGKDLF